MKMGENEDTHSDLMKHLGQARASPAGRETERKKGFGKSWRVKKKEMKRMQGHKIG